MIWNRTLFDSERGMALPIAMLLLLVMTAVSAMFYGMAFQGLRTAKTVETTGNTFYLAEAAMNESIRRMATESNLWRAKPALAQYPASYVSYLPQSFVSTNGIPTCSGSGCQRNMYPVGGGIIKNVGPIGADGDSVDQSFSVTEQLNLDTPQAADVSFDGQNGWYQVERLDEVMLDEQNLGGSLDSNPVSGEGVTSVRFRITGFGTKALRSVFGRSVVVSVVEVPSV